MLFLLQLLIVGCAPTVSSPLQATAETLYANPQPQPDFVIDVDVASGGGIFFDQAVCMVIDQEPFWTEGHNTDALRDHWMANLHFTLDDQTVSESDIESKRVLMAYPVFDDDLNIVGFYGGPVTICANTENLDVGLHLASVRIVDISGREHIFEWAFRNNNQSSSDELPTIQVLPTLEEN